jgi:TRAP-type transport system small permease protein
MSVSENHGASTGRPLPLWLAKAIELMSIVTLLILFVNIMLGAVSRYFGLGRFEWSFEVAGISFIWLTFLGTILAELGGENASFNPLDSRVGKTGKAALFRLRAAGLLLIALFLGASAAAMIYRNGMMPSPILRWPQAVQSLSMLVCTVFVAVIAAYRLWNGETQRT